MARDGKRLEQRASSLRFRIEGLKGLRQLLKLSPEQDITPRQWAVLEPRLGATCVLLSERVTRASGELLPQASDAEARRRLGEALGRIELDLCKAYAFFDTYMDVLTQRRTPELGGVLAGCDVLAHEAMRRDHPSLLLIEPPLVYCDRGFGASIIRESVHFPDGSANPMPLIQIPYSRLQEKCNLTSLLHEAGHQALQRLGLVDPIAAALGDALAAAGHSALLQDLVRRWSFEIAPDFWAFCLTGAAEARAVRDLFALPERQAMQIAISDPHPPPYLRSLLIFEWCRQAWGRGPWDDWEQEWLELYALQRAPAPARALLAEARRAAPLIGATLFNQRYRQLGGRALPHLFELDRLAPSAVCAIARRGASGVLDLRGVTPCTQLAVFSELRALAKLDDQQIDELMSRWLQQLGTKRRTLH